MSDFDKTLHAQLRHLIDDLTVAVDDDGHTRYAPKNTLMFSNFIGALIELMPTLAARAQPAQAVPVLTESELRSILQGTNHMVKNAMHGAFWPELEEACRAVEQAVRAKMGVAVPMTDPQLQTSEERRATGERIMALATSELSDLVRRARAIVVGHQRGSISLVQRHLQISYNTAAKLLEALEQEGVVSPQRQNGQREVLVLPNISGIVGKEGA